MPMTVYEVNFLRSWVWGFYEIITGVTKGFTSMEVNVVFNVGRKPIYAASGYFDCLV